MGAVVHLVKGQFRCSELNQEFMLQLDPPGKGLPDGTEFDSSGTSVPAGVPTNVPPSTSTLQFNSSDGIATPVLQNIFSINLVVTDTSFHGCVSRELVYNPPPNNNSTLYTTQGIDSSLVRTCPSTLVSIQHVTREGDIVIVPNNDEHPRVRSLNLMSPLKINYCFNYYYSVFNCSNSVTTFSIPNVCGETGQQIRSIINTETAVLHTINLKKMLLVIT